MFSNLKRRKDEFNIEEYGISVTTLEEVFLKVAAGIEAIKPDHTAFKKSPRHKEYEALDEEEDPVENDVENPKQLDTQKSGFKASDKELGDIKVKS